MGKYDSLKGKFPAFQQEASFQQKVNERKAPIQTLDAPNLARMFKQVRQNKKILQKKIKILNVELEALSQLLVESFEASGLKKLELAESGTLSFNPEPYSTIQDMTKVLAWVEKESMQSMLTLGYQVMNATNKERALKGRPSIPGTKIWIKNKPSLTGEKDEPEKEPEDED